MYIAQTVPMRPKGRATRKRDRMRPWPDVETARRVRSERSHARRLGRARRARTRAELRLAS